MTSGVRVGMVVGSDLPLNVRALAGPLQKLLAPEVVFELVVNGDCDVSGFEGPEVFRGDALRFRGAKGSYYRELLETICSTCQYVRERRPDFLFHLHQPQQYGLVVATVGRFKNVRSVVRASGEVLHWHRYLPREQWMMNYVPAFLPAYVAFRWADQIACVSGHLVDMFKEKHIDPSKARVIREPLDRVRFSPADDKQGVRERLGLPKDGLIVLLVGRMVKTEQVGFFPELVQRTLAKRDDTTFLMVGRTSAMVTTLQERFGDSVRFVEDVPYGEVHEYYQASDLYLHLSLSEGFPRTILEAVACGIHVVGSPIGDMKRLVSSCTTAEEFAAFIARGSWPKIELPPEFDNERIRENYLDLFKA